MLAEGTAREGRPLAVRNITFGDVAVASFVLCAISGAFLAASFDPRDSSRSIAEWMLANPGAVFLRNAHYWTAQVFLVFTALHVWDHLRLATERRVDRGVWLRLVLSLPVIALLMLSGFLLRGDADAQQAHLILVEMISLVPLAGPLIATFLFGADGEQLQVIYVHHAATATIIVWLVIIEHARRLWPRVGAVAAVAVLTSALSLILSAGLHDGADPVMKGSWYFLGLQEILHWTRWPMVLVVAGVIGLVLIWLIPRLGDTRAGRIKVALLAGAVVYVALCGVGLFLRGENWSFRTNWPGAPGDLRPGILVAPASIAADEIPMPLPEALGRSEGCLVCHNDVTGFSDAHRPENIGCASCHAGDPLTLNKDLAHAGMLLVPGNLATATRTCGQAGCHASIVPRVEQSIMTTFAGVISANRSAFGEAVDSAAPPPHVRDLGDSPADSHLRQLCASCHLGQEKTAWGPISEESRGGGCTACHLAYSPAATAALAEYETMPLDARASIPKVHPALTVHADNNHCFGCHSRSGRISTSYEGWHELQASPAPAELAADNPATPQFRRLDDGRYFARMPADVHQERGMECIDCHTANEVMGTGALVAHKSGQLRVTCTDCHAPQVASIAATDLDPESSKILTLRKWTVEAGQRIGVTQSGDTLVNVLVDASGQGRLRRKRTGEFAELRAPLPVCAAGAGHDRLSCSACHTNWAPRCTTCHTSFDPTAEGFDHLAQASTAGAWIESSGPFEAAPPTLGVRAVSSGRAPTSEIIDTFVPGMVLTIDRNREPGGTTDTIFQRLYAPISAHTIRREARSCESCHNDPVALGYGRGELRYVVTGAAGRWRFTPEAARLSPDGLPADAWVGFMRNRDGTVSTHANARPFTVEEQRRILRVGACLTCHSGTSEVMSQAVADFDAAVGRRKAECAMPAWE